MNRGVFAAVEIGLVGTREQHGRDGEFTIGSGGPGQLTQKLRSRLVAIQRGETPAPHGWVMRLD